MRSITADRKYSLRASLIANRPLGFSQWWQALCDHALQKELASCARLTIDLRRDAAPLSALESKLLLVWKSLVFGYLGLTCHQDGEYTLAHEAYQRCLRARKHLIDQHGLRQIELAQAMLAISPRRKQHRSLFQTQVREAESILQSLSMGTIVTEFLNEEQWRTRRQALEALVILGQYDQVIAALEHPDLQTRRDAISFLAEADGSLPADPLIVCVKSETEDWFIRWRAVLLLGRMRGSDVAAQALKDALWAAHPLIRAGAVEGLWHCLGASAQSAILPLANDPSEEVQTAVTRALGKTDDKHDRLYT